jgi:hypothetical protein
MKALFLSLLKMKQLVRDKQHMLFISFAFRDSFQELFMQAVGERNFKRRRD